MSLVYTADQNDAQAGIVGAAIKNATTAAAIKAKYESNTDTNNFTDAEKSKLASLEGSKFLGTFLTASAIPVVGAVAGSYADVDAGVGQDVQRYIFDVDDEKFVKSSSSVAGETAASIKTKYESNADTNAFTDAEKTKLSEISYAANITSWQTAFDAALA